MDKIYAFRKQLIILYAFVFLLSSIIATCILHIFDKFNILNFALDFSLEKVILYVLVFFIVSLISLHILSDLWLEKFCTNNENISLMKFLTHNQEQDIFTGLYTKSAFKAKVKESIEKEPNKIGALLSVDIDNIKFINNKYGHAVGDQFIIKQGEILKYLCRYKNTIVARIAGDEFVAYLHGFDCEEDISFAIKELYRHSEKFTVTTDDGIVNRVRFSSGLSWYPRNANNYDELFKYADFALYQAKHNNKGTMTEFNVNNYKVNYHALENSLAINQLLDNELVKFAYQPIVDLQSGDIFAYEALLRSRMENFKSPLEIINVATMQSKLTQLETLVVFTVYEDIVQNESKLGERKVFINSLPSQALTGEDVEKLVTRYEKFLDKVVVEITEQEGLNELNLNRKIQFIRENNIEIAVDDFGSGFSNEKRILSLKPNIVKIDMGLIQGISTNEDKQIIVKNMVNFCHNKGIKVVAEGVETSEDLKYIIVLGIDYVQGYYVAKPSFDFVEIPEQIKDEIIQYGKIG